MRQLLSFHKGVPAAMLMLLILPACILVVEKDEEHDDYFHRHRWQLEIIVYAERTYDADDSYTISFEANGRLNGHADCNSYDGTFVSPREGSLTIRELVSSGSSCGRTSLEESYFDVLSGAVTYRVRDDELVITARNGDRLYFYK